MRTLGARLCELASQLYVPDDLRAPTPNQCAALLASALALFSELESRGLPAPHLYVTEDNAISGEWSDAHRFPSVDLRPDGSAYVHALDTINGEPVLEREFPNGSDAKELVDLLVSLLA